MRSPRAEGAAPARADTRSESRPSFERLRRTRGGQSAALAPRDQVVTLPSTTRDASARITAHFTPHAFAVAIAAHSARSRSTEASTTRSERRAEQETEADVQ